jgi:pimeloyl-ACP methyl ester carboxylesterase
VTGDVTVVTTDVLELAYELTGPADGTPVLLLHGWPDAARGWGAVADRLHAAGWRTVVPDLRGSGGTRFRDPASPRDGSAVALARDALDLADALGLDRFPVLGHDWGGRTAYTLAALAPDRITATASLALAYQPRGAFVMPDFRQARAFWYQWLMYVDAGVEAVRADPVGFARAQWDTWSPPGWFDEDEFAATSRSFANPDWVDITLNAYRSRFLDTEPRDQRYDALRRQLAEVAQVTVPTLMVQGGADACDEPAASEGLDEWFAAGYRREVIDGVGHFPHREAPERVADLVDHHFRRR